MDRKHNASSIQTQIDSYVDVLSKVNWYRLGRTVCFFFTRELFQYTHFLIKTDTAKNPKWEQVPSETGDDDDKVHYLRLCTQTQHDYVRSQLRPQTEWTSDDEVMKQERAHKTKNWNNAKKKSKWKNQRVKEIWKNLQSKANESWWNPFIIFLCTKLFTTFYHHRSHFPVGPFIPQLGYSVCFSQLLVSVIRKESSNISPSFR